MAAGAAFFISYYAGFISGTDTRRAWYLYPQLDGNPENSSYYSIKRAVLAYGEYFILINTLIPISLVVSLEFVKLLQTPFIGHDIEMFDNTDSFKQAQPISMTLHEDLA